MPLLTKAEIEKLMQGAFYLKRPLRPVNRLDGKFAVYHYEADATWDEGVAVPELSQEGDAIFCAALPDIAQTCLDLFARLEEMEKEREVCLAFCKAQNGLPYCKNCGLGDKSDDWDPSIPACSVDNPDCESCT